MQFPVNKLLETKELTCIYSDQTVQEALNIMAQRDYSQLPIINKEGHLVGLISEQSVIRRYYSLNGNVSLLGLTVDHCQAKSTTLSRDEDVFKVLELLENAYAVIVVNDNKPVGILTDYDMARFFRDVAGGLVQIEDIEVTLRNYVETILPEGKIREASLYRAFKDKDNFDKLSLGQLIRLVANEETWPRFEKYLGPKDVFTGIMTRINNIRNQLAHFRMRLDSAQQDELEQARYWLSIRPKLPIAVSQVHPSYGQKLQSFLKQAEEDKKNDIQVAFLDMEKLLQSPLPSTAYEHESWWSNDYLNNPQASIWLKAGWRVRDVSISDKQVIFHRTNTVLWQMFFAEMLDRLKSSRPGITNAVKTQPDTYWSFSGGRSGFSFGWAFGPDNLRVELYIDAEDSKSLFDKLIKQKQEIESELQMVLDWDRLDDKKACRISVARPAKITDSPDQLEQVKAWALEVMLKFVDVFQPRIKVL